VRPSLWLAVALTDESGRPPEILCQILQLAIGQDGVKALLPFSHVDTRWRRAALGDSSLWTTIYLKHTTPPLLDMILVHAGNRLFTVHVDHRDFSRLAKLWKLVDRIEELHYSAKLGQLGLFLSSLGPAPNLKVLHIRPVFTAPLEEPTSLIRLPTIFSGCVPSLRDLTLTNTVAWPIGLFRTLVSFKCGFYDKHPISPIHVLGVLRESPSIEFLRLVGYCTLPPEFHPPAIALPSLKRCTLVGRGTASLIRFLTVPASTRVLLSKPYVKTRSVFPKFDHISVAPNLHILDDLSAISFSISDDAIRLQAKNAHGGVWDAHVDELYSFSQDSVIFFHFIRSSFEYGRTCPGFKATKTFTLDVDHSRIWESGEGTCFALVVTGFLSSLPNIEEVELRGVPSMVLSSIFRFFHGTAKFELSCPNLGRLHIVSIPIYSPRPLLEGLGRFLTERKETGAPFQSVAVKVKCELLIPAAEHRAFLTSWMGLVEKGVSLEYERTEVEKLPRCRRRDYENEYEWDHEEEWDSEYESEEEDEDEEDEDGVTGDPDDGCVGWGGWPESWPATVG